jgi:hypothetical protein
MIFIALLLRESLSYRQAECVPKAKMLLSILNGTFPAPPAVVIHELIDKLLSDDCIMGKSCIQVKPYIKNLRSINSADILDILAPYNATLNFYVYYCVLDMNTRPVDPFLRKSGGDPVCRQQATMLLDFSESIFSKHLLEKVPELYQLTKETTTNPTCFLQNPFCQTSHDLLIALCNPQEVDYYAKFHDHYHVQLNSFINSCFIAPRDSTIDETCKSYLSRIESRLLNLGPREEGQDFQTLTSETKNTKDLANQYTLCMKIRNNQNCASLGLDLVKALSELGVSPNPFEQAKRLELVRSKISFMRQQC